ncbi:MAG TPA: FG-GAP repeat protein, partial [bacterium]|nr:FG-GAP repeat protein [bacterium]
MVRSPRPTTLVFLLTAFWAAGCGGGSDSTQPGPGSSPQSFVPPLALTEPGQGHAALFGARIELDPVAGTATLGPYRLGAAGTQDVLEVVDVTQFFTSAPCTDCLKIVGVGTSLAGNPTLDISVRHPFPSPAPTRRNNQDFSVFNVEGVVLFDEAGGTVTDYPGLGEKILTSTRLVNADGYTGYLDAAYDVDYFATAATLHPYKLFFKNYTQGTFDPTSPQGFPDYADVEGSLAMGQGKGPDVQRYEIALPRPGQRVVFDLIVQASYGNSSSTIEEKAMPEYRVPQYNKKAASEVRAGLLEVTPGSPTGQGLLAGDTTSGALVHLQVLDITDASTGVTVGPNRDQIRAASDVDALAIEVAGVTSGAVTVGDPGTVLRGGVGNDPNDPLTYNVGISNEQAAPAGTYYGLVKVTDTYPVGLNAVLPEDAQRYLSPGFTEPFPLTELATFALVEVPVNSVAPPTLTATVPATGDQLGASVAVGDFNGDGVPDLAAGAYEATVAAIAKAGEVHVFYGFSTGEFAPAIVLNEITPTLNARLGFSLAADDVTGDGRDDLLAGGVFTSSAGRVQFFRSVGLGFASPASVQDATLEANARYG